MLRNRALWLFLLLYCLGIGVLAAGGRSLEETIAVLLIFGVGLLFCVLWARTRSFILAVALHGLVDTAANAPVFMQTWKL